MMKHSESYRRILNRMGYYRYQNGLIFRHLNQNSGWDGHLERCRNFILRALDIYNPENVTVLGSGWLLELPIAEMIERTSKISLVDIVHPPDVVEQTKDFKNVQLFEADVSGGLIEEVWNKTSKYSFIKKLRTLDGIIIPDYVPEGNPDLVISLNILTQLESLLIDYLKRRSKTDEAAFNIFRSEIQKRHIDMLKKYKSVLISDISELITKKSGEVSTVNTVATLLPEGQYSEEWRWDFDLTGTDYYNSRSIMNVKGIIF